MLLTSTTLNGAVSNDSNNNITMSVGNTVIANVNSSGIYFESGKKAIYTGAVLQTVVTQNSTQYSGTSGAETFLFSANITPQFASSKILVTIGVAAGVSGTAGNFAIWLRCRRGANTANTQVAYQRFGRYEAATAYREMFAATTLIGLDSPNTTSSQAYGVFVENLDGTPPYSINNNGQSVIVLQEIAQ